MESLVAGIVAGYGIAVPVGAIGAYLVVLTARTSFRVGGAGALGVATADGIYATLAVLGGAALADLLAPAATALGWVAFVVLLVLAGRILQVTLRERGQPATSARPLVTRPWVAYVGLLGATLVNPATVVYFVALVVGNQGSVTLGATERALFVVGAFAASASWQLLLAGGGAALGRAVTSPRGRLVTGLLSALLIAGLAVWTIRT